MGQIDPFPWVGKESNGTNSAELQNLLPSVNPHALGEEIRPRASLSHNTPQTRAAILAFIADLTVAGQNA